MEKSLLIAEWTWQADGNFFSASDKLLYPASQCRRPVYAKISKDPKDQHRIKATFFWQQSLHIGQIYNPRTVKSKSGKPCIRQRQTLLKTRRSTLRPAS